MEKVYRLTTGERERKRIEQLFGWRFSEMKKYIAHYSCPCRIGTVIGWPIGCYRYCTTVQQATTTGT